MHLQDRRRLSIAALVTMLALPTLWLLNRDSGSGAPSVAAAGVGVENGYITESGAEVGVENGYITESVGEVDAEDGGEDGATTGPSTANLPPAVPLEETAPVFLDGPAANGGGRPAIAVPTVPPNEVLDLEATYSSQVWNWTCIVPGVPNGTELTIVNVDNGRSTTCVATYGDPRTDGHLVMHTAGFLELADLTDAPIPVEIHK